MKKGRTREIVQATMQDRIVWNLDAQPNCSWLGEAEPFFVSSPRDRYDDRRLHHSTARPKVVPQRPKNRARW